MHNAVEAALIAQTVDALIRCGVPAREIGVISPYHAQLKLLARLLHSNPAMTSAKGVDLHIVDKFQGQDKVG